MIPALLAANAAAARNNAVLDAFSAARADTPSRAVPLATLPPLDPDIFATLLERGQVREGAPGTFYRYLLAASRSAARARRERLLLLVLVALLLLGLGALFLVVRARRLS
jgi:hypothetical protein